MSKKIYNTKKLIQSYVCYADILGFSHLSRAAIEAGEGDQFLERIKKALNKGYTRLREHAASFNYKEVEFSIKVFTDNIGKRQVNHTQPNVQTPYAPV